MRNEDMLHEAQSNNGIADEAYIAKQKEELEWEELREKEEKYPCQYCFQGRCRQCSCFIEALETERDKDTD